MKQFAIFLIAATASIITACKSTTISEEKSLDGVYESVGYGRVLKIVEGEFILADVTKYSCIPLMNGEISSFADALSIANDTLSIQDGINRYFFVKMKDAPAVCKAGSPERAAAEAKANDPEHNFEVLWDTFKTHYAYFELRKIDPNAMYATYRPLVTSETSDAELFMIMNEMLESFDDAHISISAPDEIEAAAKALSNKNNLEGESNSADISEAPKKRLRNYQVAKMVADEYIPTGTSIKNGNLRWGKLKYNVGYIQINQMMGLVDLGLSDTLSWRNYWMAYFEEGERLELGTPEEVAGINESLDIILKELAETSALIIDVRFNGGGKDEVGMDVLKRFNPKEKVVFSKKGRLGDGFTPINYVTQPASENPIKKPVYLLIARESASATEIMALSALSLPNIVQIGSRTEGVFSDVLDKELPNGWEFGLSSEVYLDMNGNNYEGLGIPPDVEIDYPRDTQELLHKVVADLSSEGDIAIIKALELQQNLK